MSRRSRPLPNALVWCREAGIPVRPGTPGTDFGKYVTRTPRCVAAPTHVQQLAALVAWLNERGLPFHAQGCAHSAGGQSLTDGVLVDLRGLAEIEVLNEDTVRVQAGCTWLKLVRRLMVEGRRPLQLTDNLLTTVGGTLSVGGFGDTSHIFGLQAHAVTQLTLVTPQGTVLDLRPPHELFAHALCGLGQVGIIAGVELRTLRRGHHLWARVLTWSSLEKFLEAAILNVRQRRFEYLRARYRYRSPGVAPTVSAGVGSFVGEHHVVTSEMTQAWELLKPDHLSDVEHVDLRPLLDEPPSALWGLACPALEVVLPLSSAVEVFERMTVLIHQAGLDACMTHGTSVMALPNPGTLPLAPLPSSECVMIAIRPMLPLEAVALALPVMHALAAIALDAGGRLYNVGVIPPGRDTLECQAGAAAKRWRELKAELDPQGLLQSNAVGAARV